MTPTHSLWARVLPVSFLAAAILTIVATPAEAVAVRSSFAQTAPIFLGDPMEGGSNPTDLALPDGKASLYPSEIVITQPARIVDVNVVLTNLTHPYPDDLELVLVGPGGQQVVLMNDAGGFGDINGIELTFSDEAAAAVSDAGQLVSDFVRSASYGGPALPAPAPTGNTSLAVFDGTLANGTWKLFAYDDDQGAVGALSGWDLILETEAAPYPSEVSVSGIGPVTDVNVKLDDLASTYPNDVDLLLVGPHGQQSTLMSDTGGGNSISDVDVTFDDEATADLSNNLTLTNGTFRPTNRDQNEDLYPAPAPAPSGATALSAFDGTDPNGVWKLFASDTRSGDFSEIGGWSLDIKWNDAAGPTGTVAVNGGAMITKSTVVTLTLSATDPAPSTGVNQMRFSNNGTTYSAYQPYAASAAWSLTAGDGAKTVYAQFTDAAGNVTTVSDTISLTTAVIAADTTGPNSKKFKPAKNATGVKPTAKVKVLPVEALAPASVTKASVVLKIKGGTKIKAKVTYDATKRLITLTPKKSLRKGTYQVTITTKVTDPAGNAWDQTSKPGSQPLKWTFKF